VCEFASNPNELHTYLAESLKLAQECYQDVSDDHHIPPPDIAQVYLLSKNIKTTRPSRKLAEPYLGPFEVINCIGSNSIHLRLPHELCLIHPMFHILQVEPSILNQFPNRQPPPPKPIKIDGKLEYEIREILDSKYDLRCWSMCKLFYYI
jgi:hypothetical protein